MNRPSLEAYDELSVAVPLQRLKGRIQSTSNFRFASRFFTFTGVDGMSAEDVRACLETIIAGSDHHQFLRDTFDPMYTDVFEITPLHEHVSVVPAAGQFENVLASAANHHLGAYAHRQRDATGRELASIRAVFAIPGEYVPFQLIPGSVPDCDGCAQYDNHLFASWFYGVAWDWCFVIVWAQRQRLAVVCLTDTD